MPSRAATTTHEKRPQRANKAWNSRSQTNRKHIELYSCKNRCIKLWFAMSRGFTATSQMALPFRESWPKIEIKTFSVEIIDKVPWLIVRLWAFMLSLGISRWSWSRKNDGKTFHIRDENFTLFTLSMHKSPYTHVQFKKVAVHCKFSPESRFYFLHLMKEHFCVVEKQAINSFLSTFKWCHSRCASHQLILFNEARF